MSVIYIIKNSVNNKVYIGQTKNSAKWRFKKHISQRNCKYKSPALCKAMEEIGIDKFWVETLEEGNFTREEAEAKEIYYIKHFNSVSPNGYNLQYGGHSKNIADETRERMSKAMKGRKIIWNDKVSKSVKRLWSDPEYKEQMRKAHSHERIILDEEKMLELRNSGVTIKKLADFFGVSYCTIEKRLKKYETN